MNDGVDYSARIVKLLGNMAPNADVGWQCQAQENAVLFPVFARGI